jgi:hypothetical protein
MTPLDPHVVPWMAIVAKAMFPSPKPPRWDDFMSITCGPGPKEDTVYLFLWDISPSKINRVQFHSR